MAFQALVVTTLIASTVAFMPSASSRSSVSKISMQGEGLKIDMRGKTVFIGGVADSTGYGWAIAKACAEAGSVLRTRMAATTRSEDSRERIF